jgi:hypothetical protein
VDNLHALAAEFSLEEIEGVLKHIKLDKAPGPDGFNGMFLEHCWYIVKDDFIQHYKDFHKGTTSLESINGPLPLWCPRNNVQRLLMISGQFLLPTHVSSSIRDRTIQDCFASTFEYLHQCHKSKMKCVIIKIDFEKAFETIEHHAILDILRCKGFPLDVIRMVKQVFSSGSSSILVNGVPRNNFACKRGVRQGDPLSPLLYVLGGDLLQSIVNLALHEGKLGLQFL